MAKSLPVVSIRPEVTILSVLRHLNYKPWFALAEYVDNSLQSARQHIDRLRSVEGPRYRLRVDIELDRDASTIRIRDNAAGITLEDFPRAFRPAELPADRTGLSEFGMGMKAASCWFTNRWSVRTKAIGEPVERIVKFDIGEIIKGKRETVDVIEVPAAPDSHYTEVSLFDLGDKMPISRTVKKLEDHLGGIYRVFLRAGEIDLWFDKEPISFEEPKVLEAPHFGDLAGQALTWRKEVHFDFGLGLSVSGFAALRHVGSTTHAGFSLFRRGRLIEGSGDETYRPTEIFGNSNSYRYQRLFGELHLEGFEVSHTKDGFRWKENEDAFLDLLRSHLKEPPLDLLAQAEEYRILQNRKTLEQKVAAATEKVAKDLQAQVPSLIEREFATPHPLPPIPATLLVETSPLGERVVIARIADEEWRILVRCQSDPAVGDFIRLAGNEKGAKSSTDATTLEIELNLAHPFACRFNGVAAENTELLVRIAAGLCLAEIMAAHTKPESKGRVLFHFNEVLREALSAP